KPAFVQYVVAARHFLIVGQQLSLPADVQDKIFPDGSNRLNEQVKPLAVGGRAQASQKSDLRHGAGYLCNRVVLYMDEIGNHIDLPADHVTDVARRPATDSNHACRAL